MTWTCLVAFKGHTFPVWDVRFSPHGHYFATASHDRTARLWATDHHQPLRIFSGHFSDVDVSIAQMHGLAVLNMRAIYSIYKSCLNYNYSGMCAIILLLTTHSALALRQSCGREGRRVLSRGYLLQTVHQPKSF